MKGSSLAFSLLYSIAQAVPATLDRRQGIVSNDIMNGNCKSLAFVWARASTEQGNMGASVGAPLCGMMKDALNGDVACQGIGGAYKATLPPNFEPKGTDQGSIDEAVSTLKLTMTQCPSSKIVAGGYSQGSAVMLNAVQALSPNEQSRIQGVAFYGYTKNQQTNGTIPGYPTGQTKVFCRQDDGVCFGTLDVTAGHLAYAADGTVQQGFDFLMQMAKGGR